VPTNKNKTAIVDGWLKCGDWPKSDVKAAIGIRTRDDTRKLAAMAAYSSKSGNHR
jgi:hypothetical protein